MHEFNIAEIDRDGALRDAAEEAMLDTRLGFLKKAGIGAASLASGGAVLGALAVPEAFASSDRPPAQLGKDDVGILNYAYLLEQLEGAFYDLALKNNVAAADPRTKQFLITVKRDEDAHRAFLKRTLGAAAIPQAKFSFGRAVTDLATFQRTSYALEKTGVGAYAGQASNIKTRAVGRAAVSILSIEARHTGAIASILNDPVHAPIAPTPFDKAVGFRETLAAVKRTGFVVVPRL